MQFQDALREENVSSISSIKDGQKSTVQDIGGDDGSDSVNKGFEDEDWNDEVDN